MATEACKVMLSQQQGCVTNLLKSWERQSDNTVPLCSVCSYLQVWTAYAWFFILMIG